MSLPSGYTKLGYIQSDGSQYIDTGFTPDENTKVIMDFQLTAAGTGNRCLFGVAGQYSFRWFGSNSVFRSNGASGSDFSSEPKALGRHTVVKTATETTLDDTYSVTTTAGTVTLSLYLLAQHNEAKVTNYAPAKLYSCKIYDNGTLVRDFIPAKNTAGVAGLWDDVNSVFYTDAAGGSFIDPSIPVGDHNTIIGGVAYKIEGGRVLLGGVEYELEKGLVMVDGVVREIVFASKLPVVITISGELSNYRYATINGTKITTTGTYEYTEMPTISVYLNAVESSGSQYTRVSLNGTVVQKGTGTYTLNTEDRNITIKFGKSRDVSEDRTYLYAIITTS